MSTGKSRKRITLEIVICVVVLVTMFVVSEGLLRRKVGPDDAVVPPLSAAASSSVSVEEREVPLHAEAAGYVRAIREASVAARVQAIVTNVSVKPGDRVRTGDLLATLSAPELGARGASAEGAVSAARAHRAQAERDVSRARALRAKDAATPVEVEQAETALAAAEGELARATEGARGEREVSGYQELRAPFDGVVLEKRVDPGDLAQPGSVLLVVGDDSRFEIEASFDERAAATLHVGSAVEVVVDALSLIAPATITEMEQAADPMTHTVLVKADAPANRELRSGQFARLRVVTGTRPGLVVPAHAVSTLGGLTMVRVMTGDGHLLSRNVRVGGRQADGMVEILSGLDAGERVALETP